MSRLEHVNVTVPDPRATARLLQQIFGWQTRWEGAAIHGGYSVHCGGDDSYVALYAHAAPLAGAVARYTHVAGLNHIGVVVDDLAAVEARVCAAGFVPRSHAEYEPGRRFYFDGPDGVEYEVVSYA